MAKVTYGKIEISFRRPTNADAFRREAIVSRLFPDGETSGMIGYYRLFGRIVTQTVSSRGLPFALPDDNATDDELKAAFDCFFREMDEDFTERCYTEFGKMAKAVDLATGPDPLPENAPKNS